MVKIPEDPRTHYTIEDVRIGHTKVGECRYKLTESYKAGARAAADGAKRPAHDNTPGRQWVQGFDNQVGYQNGCYKQPPPLPHVPNDQW